MGGTSASPRTWRLLLGCLTLLMVVGSGTAAAFTAVTSNSSSVTAAAAFPTVPQRVITDGATIEHRMDESPTSATTSVLADAAGAADPGTVAGADNGPSLRWDLDDGSGTTAADRSGAANPGTLGGAGATWTAAGRESSSALQLDGSSTAYVSAAAPAVDTTKSFTVSAWVYLTAATLPTSNKFVVTQDGTTVSAFALNYDATHQWSFWFPRTDTLAFAYDQALSSVVPVPRTWTHLVGVFDTTAAGAQARLYVNNTLNTAPHTSTWSTTGTFQVGRLRVNGIYGQNFPGLITDVRAYRRALSATEVTALYTDTPSAVYQLNEGTGATTQDGSATGTNTMTLGAGATWTTAGHNGPALTLDGGSTAYTVGTAAAVSTNASFSVAAWLYPTNTTSYPTAVSQNGGTASSFLLGIANGKWRFVLTPADAATNPDEAQSPASAVADAWTHVAGVFNNTTHTATLYVNGIAVASVSHNTTWNTTNPVQLGRYLWGSYTGNWTGMIDQVRTYTRALTATEVANAAAPAPMTAGLPGALQGPQQGMQSSTAVALDGTTNLYNDTAVTNPGPFTVECWFKTTGNAGGTLIGFNSSSTTLTAGNGDRVLFLDSGNKLSFGVSAGTPAQLRSTATYNDGSWHYAAASVGPAGAKLYVDGELEDSVTSATSAQNYTGYWRIGGAWLSTFSNRPANQYFTGTIDEVAIYPTQLSDQQMSWHYHANH